MPVTRERKDELIAELAKELGKSQALILSDYRGLPTVELAYARGRSNSRTSFAFCTRAGLFLSSGNTATLIGAIRG